MQSIQEAYRHAERRLLLLDYDGTLVDIAATPDQAEPDRELLTLLASLAGDHHNEVVIISGRDQNTLEKWLGDLDVALVAEHGSFIKPNGSLWQSVMPPSHSWWPAVETLMETACTQATGSFIEHKQAALAWHYRECDQSTARQTAKLLREALGNITPDHDISVLPGRKVIEVTSGSIDKGSAANLWLAQDDFDFIMAAGDDVTDENLFAALPDDAYSFAVGETVDQAGYAVSEPATLLRLLSELMRTSATPLSEKRAIPILATA